MLGKTVLDSICPACRFALDFRNPKILRPLQQPWATSYRFASSYRQKRSTPSRMVLSDSVSRRTDDDGKKKPRRRLVDGPFAGMNRTVANIDPTRRIAQSRSPKNQDSGNKSHDREDRPRFKALRMQRALTSISYGSRMNLKDRLNDVESFDQFDLLPSIKEALLHDMFKGKEKLAPTPVQKLAIPALLGQSIGASKRSRAKPRQQEGRREFLLAAETGSGKTLAYLLPSVNAMKLAEAEDPSVEAYQQRFEEEKALRADPKVKGKSLMEPHPTTARPRVIVLVPTSELVDQVGAVAKKLSHSVKFKVEKISANFDAKVIERRIYRPEGLDVVIATPHLLASIAESDPNILSRVTHLIIDEADSLMDRSFSPVTTSIMDRAMPSLKQLIMCSATIPKRLDHYLEAQFPKMDRITTPNLHAIPRRVQLGVIDASKDPYRNNKSLACADAIWSIGKDASTHEGVHPGEVDVKRIMVFVNEREKTQEVADYLVSKGIDAVALHRDTSEQRQSEMLATFTLAAPIKRQLDEVERSSPVRAKRHLQNTKVIVATDLASRGIDTVGVRHVVLYDVPHTTIDFIHRLGRVGRKGTRGGRGIVIVGKDDRRDVVAEVKESMFMGQALL